MKNVMKNIVLASLLAFCGCGELSEVTIEGLPGPQGPMGPQGPAGTSCGIVGNSIVCTDGSSLDLDVFGCSAERVENEEVSGVLVTCNSGSEETQVFISDGADGRDGIDGQDGSDGQDDAADA